MGQPAGLCTRSRFLNGVLWFCGVRLPMWLVLPMIGAIVYLLNIGALWHLQPTSYHVKLPEHPKEFQQVIDRNLYQNQNSMPSKPDDLSSSEKREQRNESVAEGDADRSMEEEVGDIVGEEVLEVEEDEYADADNDPDGPPLYFIDDIHRRRYYNQSKLPDMGIGNITITVYGRLGNLMFQYASLLGIALTNGMHPIFPRQCALWDIFQLNVTALHNTTSDWPIYVEEAPMIYDPLTETLNRRRNIHLLGYYQSWRYFQTYKDLLRKHFQLKPHLARTAKAFLADTALRMFGNESEKAVMVGVHIRRGDMVYQENLRKGYTVATQNYLHIAMSYMEAKYGQWALFVVASDSMSWAKNNIRAERGKVVFSEGHSDHQDLAILSLCKDLVITVGTFGWWAAWLNQGTVVYYKDFPEPFSKLDDEFNADDFWMDWLGWIGLTASVS